MNKNLVINNRKNIFKIVIITIIIMSLILMSIVSQDSHHKHSCREEHCFTCILIHMSQVIINLVATIFIYSFTCFSILIE